MPRPEDMPPIGESLSEIIDRTTKIVHEEIELAKAEVKVGLFNIMRGSVTGIVGGVFAFFGIFILLIAISFLVADAIGAFYPWLGFFVVAFFCFLIGALLAWLAFRAINKGSKQVTPTQAIDEAKQTAAALKSEEDKPQTIEGEAVEEATPEASTDLDRESTTQPGATATAPIPGVTAPDATVPAPVAGPGPATAAGAAAHAEAVEAADVADEAREEADAAEVDAKAAKRLARQEAKEAKAAAKAAKKAEAEARKAEGRAQKEAARAAKKAEAAQKKAAKKGEILEDESIELTPKPQPAPQDYKPPQPPAPAEPQTDDSGDTPNG